MCMTKFASFVIGTVNSTGDPRHCLNSWQKKVRLLLNGTEKGAWRNAFVPNWSAGCPLLEVESETPVPTGTEVLIKTVACGVCHSDIHLHDGGFELGGGKVLNVGREGHVLGHEVFGEVVAVGPDAQDVAGRPSGRLSMDRLR